jgi:hypothetical protein
VACVGPPPCWNSRPRPAGVAAAERAAEELAADRSRQRAVLQDRISAARDLRLIVSTLRKILTDTTVATALNRARLTTPSGQSWTARRVAAFRRQHAIAGYSAPEREREGWLTQAEAATRLQISPMSLSRLVSSGILPAEQPNPGLPTVIRVSGLGLPIVQRAIHALKSHNHRPLPADPNQRSLFVSGDFQVSQEVCIMTTGSLARRGIRRARVPVLRNPSFES